MKLRLRVTAAGGTTTFEHAGPVVHIGRDAGCELALEGEASTGVSRRHARIELAPGGATVADDGSSNGTLRNDKAIEGAVPLRVGDRIQLGYTGPTLTVLELDLTAPAAAGASLLPVVALVGAGLAVAAVAVIVLAVGLGWLVRKPEPQPTGEVAVTTTPQPATPPERVTTTDRVTPTERATDPERPTAPEHITPPKDTQRRPPPTTEKVKPPPPPVTPVAEGLEEKPVGRYLALPEWGASVLLTRRDEAYPWAPLRPDEKVVSAQTLLALPGYRTEVLLDSQVQLTLWGNLPQFDRDPPLLLESIALLRVPEKGVDLDVTLEWGRVKFANRKSSGPARVRLRFRREVWDVTLPDGASEAVAELWAPLPPPPPGSRRPTIPLALGLFNKGPVTLQTAGAHAEHFDLPDRSRVAWTSAPGAPLFREQMKELPGWWARPPDPSIPLVADAMLALKDWAPKLTATGDILDTIHDEVRKSNDPGFRQEGVFFLEPLNGAPYLVNYLEDGRHDLVRRAAAHALRAWLTREPGRATELAALLQVKVNSPRKAARIVELLNKFPEDALKRPDTYRDLIKDLEDDSLVVRELASWQLGDMAPEASRKIAYDPSAPGDQRRQAVAEWQKAVPPGSVPRPPAQ
jgi:hypothetical protein